MLKCKRKQCRPDKGKMEVEREKIGVVSLFLSERRVKA